MRAFCPMQHEELENYRFIIKNEGKEKSSKLFSIHFSLAIVPNMYHTRVGSSDLRLVLFERGERIMIQNILIKNKRFWVNVFILLSTISVILLCYLMHRYVGEIRSEYLSEEGVFAIPFNIGFRSSVLFGAVAIVLFQLVLYAAANCNKTYFYDAWLSGVWFANAILFPEIAGNSKIFFCFRDNNRAFLTTEWYKIWNGLSVGIYVVVALIILKYLFILLFQSGKEVHAKRKACSPFTIIMAIIGLALLILRSYTNLWYIGVCCGTFILSWFVLKQAEKLWLRYGLSQTGDISLWDAVLNKLIGLEEDEEECDETKDTLDILIGYYNKLEEKPLSDSEKKEEMIHLIREMRKNYDAPEENTAD